MRIKSITIGGYKNIKETTIELNGITAIVSLNNYGKSNLLEAIDFGTDYLSANSKERTSMMRWTRGIPINKHIDNDEYIFSVEFASPELKEYQFVRYGFKFKWYRDDGTGERITDEWIEARPSESVRYTSYLKRKAGKYRKEKNTLAFRNINLSDNQLAIDVLSAIDDIEIHPIISSIKSLDYHICSSLDLRDRFSSVPIEYISHKEDDSIDFDDKDVPRALFQLQEKYPDKFNMFLDSVYTLFPEFENVAVLPYELRKDAANIQIITSDSSGNVTSNEASDNIPFRIRDELYKVIITSSDLNQPIDMMMMSTGTKRIIWLLANIYIASSNNMCLVGVEELETSIHPRLMKSLLEILNDALSNSTSMIVSSHSPYLVQYLKPEKIYVGVPTDDGTAVFRKVRTNRVKHLIASARNVDLSVGEYLFDLMSGDSDAIDTLSFFLEN